MAGLTPQEHAARRRGASARERVHDAGAGPWLRQPAACPKYSPRQQEVLSKAGQLILEWAVEVARYEADIDWQWIHRDDDPAVTAKALARLIHETRAAADRAEALLNAAIPEDQR
jgi:hypothetical protein